MSVHEAKLGDIFQDENGTIWRVMMTCNEPTVHMEQLVSKTEPRDIRSEISGGVSGQMWFGFVRLEPRKT